LAKLNRDPLVIAEGDMVEKFLLLSHGHDGSLAVRAGFTPIRVVCQNTLSMAHGSDASRLIRIKHTKDVLENLANVREIMDAANAEFEATAEQYRRLARKSVNQADLRKYVKRVLKIETRTTPASASRTLPSGSSGWPKRAGQRSAFGAGNSVDGLQRVSEWLTYNRGRSGDNRLNSLWFGDSALTNRHALEVAPTWRCDADARLARRDRLAGRLFPSPFREPPC
jgi:hypothetical protein